MQWPFSLLTPFPTFFSGKRIFNLEKLSCVLTFYKTLTGDQIFEVDSFLKSFWQNYNFAFDKSHSNDFLQVLEILPVKKGRWSAVKY